MGIEEFFGITGNYIAAYNMRWSGTSPGEAKYFSFNATNDERALSLAKGHCSYNDFNAYKCEYELTLMDLVNIEHTNHAGRDGLFVRKVQDSGKEDIFSNCLEESKKRAIRKAGFKEISTNTE